MKVTLCPVLVSLLFLPLMSSQAFAIGMMKVTLEPKLDDATKTCSYALQIPYPSFPDVEIYRTCGSDDVVSKQNDGLCDYDKVGKIKSSVRRLGNDDFMLSLFASAPYATGAKPCSAIDALIVVRQ